MVKYKEADLDLVFSALSDGTRRAILRRLAAGEATVSELAEPFAVSLPAVSKHLRVLEHCGLVRRARDGRIHRIQLDAKPMKNAAEWIERTRRSGEGEPGRWYGDREKPDPEEG